MERKKGEIFEHNGEWYQCVIGGHCKDCAFNEERKCYTLTNNNDPIGDCPAERRTDKHSVIFKKLEKVEEPYVLEDKKFQKYKVFKIPYIYHKIDCSWQSFSDPYYISLEIKQNKKDMGENNDIQPYDEIFSPGTVSNTKYLAKEDMEENKTTPPKEDNALTRIVYAYVNGKISDKELIRSIKEMSDEYPYNKNNLNPFSLELAKQGKPVCTRDGRKARIICFDRMINTPIVALIERDNHEEVLQCYFDNGRCCCDATSDYDLMMVPENKEGWVNVYRDCDGVNITKDDNIYSSREAAIASAQFIDGNRYVATTKINWEE